MARDEMIRVRVSTAEKSRFEDKAAKANMSPGDFFRRAMEDWNVERAYRNHRKRLCVGRECVPDYICDNPPFQDFDQCRGCAKADASAPPPEIEEPKVVLQTKLHPEDVDPALACYYCGALPGDGDELMAIRWSDGIYHQYHPKC